MGITRRLLDLARSNLNALIDPAGRRTGDGGGADDATLDGFSDEELAAELELRRVRRRRQEESRAARQQAEQAARERARTPGSATGSSTGSPRPGTRRAATGSQTGSQTGRNTGPASSSSPTVDQARLASLYAQLETPAGANLDTVKRNFRRLMRQHHPDMNVGSPERQKAATERTMRLTTAYDELERFLSPRAGR